MNSRDINSFELIIFDKDGTICYNKNGGEFINAMADQGLIPGVSQHLFALRVNSKLLREIAIASNQAGVAFGHMPQEEAEAIMGHAKILIGADQLHYCFFHPDATEDQWKSKGIHPFRKPRGGMLVRAMVRAGVEPQHTLMVGDRPEDAQAAYNVGCDFMWAHDFFEREPPDNWQPPDPDHGEGYLGEK